MTPLPSPGPASSSGAPVALAGLGAISAAGCGVNALREALLANSSCLTPRANLRTRAYQSIVAGWATEPDPGEPEKPGRAYRFALAAAREALANAQTHHPAPPLVTPERRALVLSTTKAEIEALETVFLGNPCPHAALRQAQPALLARDLAESLSFRGPVQAVSVACVSGLIAMQQGAALIRRGEADLALVVGVDLISHFVLSGFTTLKALDPDGCRPFDRDRVGLSLGEGAGAVLLWRPDLAPPQALRVTGWGASNDANHLTGPSRDGSGLAKAILRALARANLAPAQVDYVHLHGTGTPYNDAMEALALRAVFGAAVPPFSSSKGLLGHTLGAAGVLETVLCGLSLDTQTLPGNPRLNQPDPAVPPSIVRETRPAPGLRRILKVNCGFAGTNAALVLERSAS